MDLKATIKTCISAEAPSCDINDSLRNVAEKITQSYAAACVVNSGDEIVGIITDTDVGDNIAQGKDLEQVKAGEFMTSCELITKREGKLPCIQLFENETIENALKVMAKGGIHHILVWSESGKVIGIVSTKDLLKGVLKSREFES